MTDGKFHGRYRCKWNEGQRLECEYRNGQYHGRKVCYNPDGTINFEEVYNMGELVKWLILWWFIHESLFIQYHDIMIEDEWWKWWKLSDFESLLAKGVVSWQLLFAYSPLYLEILLRVFRSEHLSKKTMVVLKLNVSIFQQLWAT